MLPFAPECKIKVRSEDWQSYSNAVAFGKQVGMTANAVDGSGHVLSKAYVGNLLDYWIS